ncbi:mycofactocin biosynthesis peptidyl-dipeptidase MftE [Agromyces archimandritae]|uniref:Mycofactocin biosynthesis peptidyl-dipeptidase MftE n=1 Tax=Agromyces archimandritae TaxID=2781962 RepID=A0A975FNL7_9MICO|nr:mycofactocin biosynthesis peptidyl-dipeptidase MftE [Agromyces archimandritae]QTX05730.1 mycofactocin biosynthesis peptidyl-dipeptidase MftE [Agromyces archimandritae]
MKHDAPTAGDPPSGGRGVGVPGAGDSDSAGAPAPGALPRQDASGEPARLADRRWVNAGGATLLVPVGSFEQHGPHLPFDTDTVIAEALAEALAARLRGADAVTAPPIAFGASGEHAGFDGTVSIGTAVLEAVLIEIGRSVDWAARLVFVNGHGGNLAALAAAVPRLRFEGRAAVWLPADPGPAGAGDLHAGRDETSLMLHLDPSRVDAARLEPGAPGTARELLPALQRGGVRAVSPNGVLGDPRGASAAEGAALFAAMTEAALGRLERDRPRENGCLG